MKTIDWKSTWRLTIGLLLASVLNHSAWQHGAAQVPGQTPGQSGQSGQPVPPPPKFPESNIKLDITDVNSKVAAKAAAISGASVTLTPPVNFPLPLYPNATTATFTTKPPVVAATFTTKDPPSTAFAWYKQAVSQRGWTVPERKPSAAEVSGRAMLIMATKDNVTLNVTCVKIPNGDGAIINIHSMQIPKPGQ